LDADLWEERKPRASPVIPRFSVVSTLAREKMAIVPDQEVIWLFVPFALFGKMTAPWGHANYHR
jgi:hypothetical protein